MELFMSENRNASRGRVRGRCQNPLVESLICYMDTTKNWVFYKQLGSFGLTNTELEWPMRRGRIIKALNSMMSGAPAYGLPGFLPCKTFHEHLLEVLIHMGSAPNVAAISNILEMTFNNPTPLHVIRGALLTLESRGLVVREKRVWIPILKLGDVSLAKMHSVPILKLNDVSLSKMQPLLLENQ